jgi:hypothetical protein
MSTTLAAHQPNYIPWLGYFYKMLNCDIFILSDNVQYTHTSYIQRNIIKTSSGSKWLTINVQAKGTDGQPISAVKINNDLGWNTKHWTIIRQYYSRSPHFHEYEEEFKAIYEKNWENLADLNETLIKTCCKALNINHIKFVKGSSLNTTTKGTDQIIDECQAVGAQTYLSGYGAINYMEEEKFKKAGITLKYYDFEHPVYRQLWGEFIPNLSVIDLLFNAGEKSLSILQGAHKSPIRV